MRDGCESCQPVVVKYSLFRGEDDVERDSDTLFLGDQTLCFAVDEPGRTIIALCPFLKPKRLPR